MRFLVAVLRRVVIVSACVFCYAVGAWWQQAYPAGLGILMVVSIAVVASSAVELLGAEKRIKDRAGEKGDERVHG